MVKQGIERFLLPFLCRFSHTNQPMGHAVLALCRVHVRRNDVLLRLCPSLPNLRRRLPLLVRLVHRYYGTVRLLQHVHVRRAALSLRGPALIVSPRRAGDLPVLVHVVLSACAGSPTTQDRTATREITRLPCCLPSTRHGVGILIRDFLKLNSPANRYLYLRFSRHLTMSNARLEARMDSLFPFL